LLVDRDSMELNSLIDTTPSENNRNGICNEQHDLSQGLLTDHHEQQEVLVPMENLSARSTSTSDAIIISNELNGDYVYQIHD